MTIQEFIKKAIEGSWKPETHREVIEFNPNNRNGARSSVRASYTHFEVLLDPLAWQAVGKVEGWDEGKRKEELYKKAPQLQWMWQFMMHRMIDALIEGKSIEEFLETL